MPNDREALRAVLLARLTSLFSASLDLEATLRGVTEIFVPDFADWCSVDVYDRGVAARRVSDAMAVPGLEEVLSQFRTVSPLGDAASPLARLLGESAPRVFDVERPAELPWSSHDEEHQAMLETLLPCSILVAPLRARESAFGVLSLISVRGSRRYTDDDIALIEDVARRAAFAIHTSSMLRELQEEVRLRREAAEELAESHREHQELFEAIPIPLWAYDVETLRFLLVNDAALAQYGYLREELRERTVLDIRPAAERARLVEARQASEGQQVAGVFTHCRKDGSTLLAEVTVHEMPFEGRTARIVTARDVTERVRAYESLLIADERHRLVSIATKEAVWDWDPASGRMEWNAAFATLFHFEPDRTVATRSWCDSRIHPDDRARAVRELELAMARRDEVCVRTYRFLRGDDTYVNIADRAVIAYEGGLPARVIGALADVTLEHQLGEQLGVAQRMEAVGRLAGGIAHDFNNLLTAIRGFTTFALEAQPPNDPSREDLDQVLQATDRAAALTKQLLAFSRRQVLQPQLVFVNDLLKALERMLARVLGADIELRTILEPDVWPILVDPGQFEQVIMNLVINSRDAMRHGGLLTIESSNVDLDEAHALTHVGTTAGQYVMVAVSDSGVGMDAQTLARIFEPFFTTKERDRGTGLGLATSYGIVRQSGGHISVQSEPEKGCIFRVYLPRASADDIPAARKAPADVAHVDGNETILLVEDDERVRRVSSSALRRRGYRVLEAPSAEEALRHFAAESDAVRLVVTDVVLPRMSGAQLARELSAMRPALRVLYVSGYTEDSIVQQGRLDPGAELLEKPFSPDALARRVRVILDRN